MNYYAWIPGSQETLVSISSLDLEQAPNAVKMYRNVTSAVHYAPVHAISYPRPASQPARLARAAPAALSITSPPSMQRTPSLAMYKTKSLRHPVIALFQIPTAIV